MQMLGGGLDVGRAVDSGHGFEPGLTMPVIPSAEPTARTPLAKAGPVVAPTAPPEAACVGETKLTTTVEPAAIAAQPAPVPAVAPTATPTVAVPLSAQVVQPVSMSRDLAWTEYRRAITAATSREAVEAATLEWVRAVDRIKRSPASRQATGTDRPN
jgi:hypothetical protein